MSSEVTFGNAFWAPWRLFDGCHFSSFPTGVLSIINILLVISLIFIFGISLVEGKVGYAFLSLFIGYISILFNSYVQAYLIKGCECKNELSELKKKIISSNTVTKLI